MMLKPNSSQLVRRLPVEWSDRAWTPRVTVCDSARSRIIVLPPQPSVERRRFAARNAPSLRVNAPGRSLRRSRPSFGFTLIELLVVISIIGILAALLLPALSAVKKQAAKAKARTEISSIVSAINHYESVYSRMPISTQATQALGTSPDFTYGTVTVLGAQLANKYGPITPSIEAVDQSGAPLTYQADNSEVMAILMDLTQYPNGNATVNANHAKNPQHTPFLTAKQVSDTVSPGVGLDGVFRDPWGSPYIISMDINGDNKTRDGFYARAAVSQQNGTIGINGLVQGDPNIQNSFEANTTVMVWSLGPDGKADPNQKANADVNRDNITSW